MDLTDSDVAIETIVEHAQGGCTDAFHQLVVRFQEPIRLYFARNVTCGSVADDLSQEVFIAAFRQLEGFQRRSKVFTWLMGIARNKLLHYLRTQFRHRKNFAAERLAEKVQERIRYLEDAQNEANEHADFLDALDHCLSELPAAARNLIEQFYFEGNSSSEIAEQKRCSSGAIRMKLLRIREILQKCILTNSNVQH